MRNLVWSSPFKGPERVNVLLTRYFRIYEAHNPRKKIECQRLNEMNVNMNF